MKELNQVQSKPYIFLKKYSGTIGLAIVILSYIFLFVSINSIDVNTYFKISKSIPLCLLILVFILCQKFKESKFSKISRILSLVAIAISLISIILTNIF